MSVTQSLSLSLGGLTLVWVWLWPVPALDWPPFVRHMVMHMAVVGVAAPLLALGLAGGRWDPVRYWPKACSAIIASMLELLVVWAWHAPQLHHLARHVPIARVIEQLSFLAVGMYLWLSAIGGTASQRQARSVPGVVGLLLTSMHMTLLGALIALTPRELYQHSHPAMQISPIVDQQLGGAIMLFTGVAAYLVGGVALAASVFRPSLPKGEQP